MYMKKERNHGQEQLKMKCPVPFLQGLFISHPCGYQTSDRGHKVDKKILLRCNCPESSPVSEGSGLDTENGTCYRVLQSRTHLLSPIKSQICKMHAPGELIF